MTVRGVPCQGDYLMILLVHRSLRISTDQSISQLVLRVCYCVNKTKKDSWF